MSAKRFADRREAGRVLAELLAAYANEPEVIVLALPRGGVPVAFEIAQALHVPLEVFVVRKLGVPGREELAFGAVAAGGVQVINRLIVEQFGITPEEITQVLRAQQDELERREQLYHRDQPQLRVGGATVLLVDDGLATGATMRAAIMALRQMQPRQLVVAVPVASAPTAEALRAEVDGLVCSVEAADFRAVGQWYADFRPTLDAEVSALLMHAKLKAERGNSNTQRSQD